MATEDPFIYEEALALTAMCIDRSRRAGHTPSDEDLLFTGFLIALAPGPDRVLSSPIERATIVRAQLDQIFQDVRG